MCSDVTSSTTEPADHTIKYEIEYLVIKYTRKL